MKKSFNEFVKYENPNKCTMALYASAFACIHCMSACMKEIACQRDWLMNEEMRFAIGNNMNYTWMPLYIYANCGAFHIFFYK